MGKPYSLDLRERVVAAIEGGMSTHQVGPEGSTLSRLDPPWALEDRHLHRRLDP